MIREITFPRFKGIPTKRDLQPYRTSYRQQVIALSGYKNPTFFQYQDTMHEFGNFSTHKAFPDLIEPWFAEENFEFLRYLEKKPGARKNNLYEIAKRLLKEYFNETNEKIKLLPPEEEGISHVVGHTERLHTPNGEAIIKQGEVMFQRLISGNQAVMNFLLHNLGPERKEIANEIFNKARFEDSKLSKYIDFNTNEIYQRNSYYAYHIGLGQTHHLRNIETVGLFHNKKTKKEDRVKAFAYPPYDREDKIFSTQEQNEWKGAMIPFTYMYINCMESGVDPSWMGSKDLGSSRLYDVIPQENIRNTLNYLELSYGEKDFRKNLEIIAKTSLKKPSNKVNNSSIKIIQNSIDFLEGMSRLGS